MTMVYGLTGAIAMGKSTVARQCRRWRIPVFDADQAVHQLYHTPALLEWMPTLCPDAVQDHKIDRQILAEFLMTHPDAMTQLEAKLSPYLHHRVQTFIDRHCRARRPRILLDIPLLFEAGYADYCDTILVVSAPATVQQHRLRARYGDARGQKIAAFLQSRAWLDVDKRACADFVLNTGLGHRYTLAQLKRIFYA